MLGDVQIREHLEARNDGPGEALRRGRQRVERAVETVTDVELLFEGLEMNVRCPGADGLRQYLVDETDERRLTGQLLKVRLTKGGIVNRRDGRPQFAEDGVERLFLLAVMLVDEPEHTRGIGHGEPHLALEGKGQVVDQAGIEWVDREQRDGEVIERDGGHAISECQAPLDQCQRIVRQGGRQIPDASMAEVLGDGQQQGGLIEQAKT